jgi:hypothetical protein
MHNTMLNHLLAQSRLAEYRRVAEARARVPRPRLQPRPVPPSSPVTLRYAFPDDAEAVARLATLDSAAPPPQPLLLAEIAGELRAALSLSDGTVIADPFYPNAAVIELLDARGRQLRGTEHRRRRPGLLPRTRARLATWR